MSKDVREYMKSVPENVVCEMMNCLKKDRSSSSRSANQVTALTNMKVAMRTVDEVYVVAIANECISMDLARDVVRCIVLCVCEYVLPLYHQASTYLVRTMVKHFEADDSDLRNLIYDLIHTFCNVPWSADLRYLFRRVMMMEYVHPMENPPSNRDVTPVPNGNGVDHGKRTRDHFQPIVMYETVTRMSVFHSIRTHAQTLARGIMNATSRTTFTHFCAAIVPGKQFGPVEASRIMHAMSYAMTLATRDEAVPVWEIMMYTTKTISVLSTIIYDVQNMFILWLMLREGERKNGCVADGVGRSRALLVNAINVVCIGRTTPIEEWKDVLGNARTLTYQDTKDMIGMNVLRSTEVDKILRFYRSEVDPRNFMAIKMVCRRALASIGHVEKEVLREAARWSLPSLRIASRMRTVMWFLNERMERTGVSHSPYALGNGDIVEEHSSKKKKIVLAKTAELPPIVMHKKDVQISSEIDVVMKMLFFLKTYPNSVRMWRPSNAGTVQTRTTVTIDPSSLDAWMTQIEGSATKVASGGGFDFKSASVYDMTLFTGEDVDRAVFLCLVQKLKCVLDEEGHKLVAWKTLLVTYTGGAVLLCETEDGNGGKRCADADVTLLVFRALLDIPGVNEVAIYTKKGKGLRATYELPSDMHKYSIDPERTNTEWVEKVLVDGRASIAPLLHSWKKKLVGFEYGKDPCLGVFRERLDLLTQDGIRMKKILMSIVNWLLLKK